MRVLFRSQTLEIKSFLPGDWPSATDEKWHRAVHFLAYRPVYSFIFPDGRLEHGGKQ
jgi:hypothetical protein